MPQQTLEERFRHAPPTRGAFEKHRWMVSEEQRFVLWGIKEGWSAARIGRALGVNEATVRRFRSRFTQEPNVLLELRLYEMVGRARDDEYRCLVCGDQLLSRRTIEGHVLGHYLDPRQVRTYLEPQAQRPDGPKTAGRPAKRDKRTRRASAAEPRPPSQDVARRDATPTIVASPETERSEATVPEDSHAESIEVFNRGPAVAQPDGERPVDVRDDTESMAEGADGAEADATGSAITDLPAEAGDDPAEASDEEDLEADANGGERESDEGDTWTLKASASRDDLKIESASAAVDGKGIAEDADQEHNLSETPREVGSESDSTLTREESDDTDTLAAQVSRALRRISERRGELERLGVDDDDGKTDAGGNLETAPPQQTSAPDVGGDVDGHVPAGTAAQDVAASEVAGPPTGPSGTAIPLSAAPEPRLQQDVADVESSAAQGANDTPSRQAGLASDGPAQTRPVEPAPERTPLPYSPSDIGHEAQESRAPSQPSDPGHGQLVEDEQPGSTAFVPPARDAGHAVAPRIIDGSLVPDPELSEGADIPAPEPDPITPADDPSSAIQSEARQREIELVVGESVSFEPLDEAVEAGPDPAGWRRAFERLASQRGLGENEPSSSPVPDQAAPHPTNDIKSDDEPTVSPAAPITSPSETEEEEYEFLLEEDEPLPDIDVSAGASSPDPLEPSPVVSHAQAAAGIDERFAEPGAPDNEANPGDWEEDL